MEVKLSQRKSVAVCMRSGGCVNLCFADCETLEHVNRKKLPLVHRESRCDRDWCMCVTGVHTGTQGYLTV